MYDAVQLFALGLKELAQAQDVKTEPLSCNKKQTWLYGNSLLNYMKSVSIMTQCVNCFRIIHEFGIWGWLFKVLNFAYYWIMQIFIVSFTIYSAYLLN